MSIIDISNDSKINQEPRGILKIFYEGVLLSLSVTTCFRKLAKNRHPALEFQANNNSP